MVAIISLLIVLTLSILITRIATVALMHTGLSREAARFQARSAFTGVGYTTRESENLVNHPVRRRIVLILMLLGNAGIITAISSLILSFIDQSQTSATWRVFLLVAGIVVLWRLASSLWVDRHLSRLISWAFRRYTSLHVQDLVSLLKLSGDYRITDLQVSPEDWLANRKLSEVRLRDEGVAVLGVTRENGKYIGTPNGSTKILPKDTLILYGRVSSLKNLDQRHAGSGGDREHDKARAEQQHVTRQEKEEDRAETHRKEAEDGKERGSPE